MSVAFSGARIIQAQGSADEQALWKLEQNYWRYVQENDLAAYATLWHERFLGWPSVSPVPVHKDHITDWITAQTSKGLKFVSRFQAGCDSGHGGRCGDILLGDVSMGGQERRWGDARYADHAYLAPVREGLAYHWWHVHAGARRSAKVNRAAGAGGNDR